MTKASEYVLIHAGTYEGRIMGVREELSARISTAEEQAIAIGELYQLEVLERARRCLEKGEVGQVQCILDDLENTTVTGPLKKLTAYDKY